MADPAQLGQLRPISSVDAEAVSKFLLALPEGDRTFFKEHISTERVRGWSEEDQTRRLLLVGADGEIQAYMAILPGVGWSSHVGELRLVVHDQYRRRGIGRMLARRALIEAVDLGLRKLTVEVVAEKQGDVEMFRTIGFDAEALLKDQIMSHDGRVQDLVLLSHDIGSVRSDLEVLGTDRELGTAGT
jgi:ribosomal protein S18 acetylase RimI-like enzyme